MGFPAVLRFTTSFPAALLCLVALACPSLALADVLQMPIGSDFITLPGDAELCGAGPEGFVVDASRKRIRPRNDLKAGYEVTAKVAPHKGSCEASVPVTLIVTGALPVFDPTSVTVAIDAGRIEVSGKYLQGAQIGYAVDGKTGSDVCLEITRDQEERE